MMQPTSQIPPVLGAGGPSATGQPGSKPSAPAPQPYQSRPQQFVRPPTAYPTNPVKPSNTPLSPTGTDPNSLPAMAIKFNRQFQKMLDDLTPYYMQRWIGTLILGVLYIIRAFTAGGWYIVTYALGIYLLNLLLAFLSPKFDPAMEDEDEDGGESGGLPTKSDDEFRPFIRRLPEFKFWFYSTRAFIIAFICTLFTFFDLPVFWPILLVYFIILFTLTMRRQIQHMIKYRYIPFNVGKKKYSSGGKK